jgi:1,4-alpha-glucan branching enzyme
MIFQGQEFLEPEWFRDTVPLDWSLSDDFHGIVRMYHDLIWLRRNLGGFTAGLQGDHVNVYHVNNSAKVIAMHRWANGGPGDDTVVLLNFSNMHIPNYHFGLPAAGTWKAEHRLEWLQR